MIEELKPCPFCGGKPTFVHATSEDIGNGYVCMTLAVISCDHCMFDMTGETDDDAVVTWNARAERECRFALEEDREALAEKAACGPGEFVTQDMPELLWTCSACGEQYRNGLDALPGWLKHCPNCGAKVAG